MKSFVTFILSCTLVAASLNDPDDQQLEILHLPVDKSDFLDVSDVGPRNTRHRSLIQNNASPPGIVNPEALVISNKNRKSPTTITAAMSADYYFDPVVVEKKMHKQESLSFPSVKSVPLISFQAFQISKFNSPRNSQIISQLNLLDHLMASAQFPLATESKSKALMAGHLSVLKAHCRHLAASYGPLNPKSTNCAFRYHELVRFIQLLTKYETSSFSNTLAKRNWNLSFCSALVHNLKRLQTLVNMAISEYSSRIIKASKTTKYSNPGFSALLSAHSNEVKEFDKLVNSVHFDLQFYCESNQNNDESIESARELISKFFNLAFI